jgi:hypothetical protein
MLACSFAHSCWKLLARLYSDERILETGVMDSPKRVSFFARRCGQKNRTLTMHWFAGVRSAVGGGRDVNKENFSPSLSASQTRYNRRMWKYRWALKHIRTTMRTNFVLDSVAGWKTGTQANIWRRTGWHQHVNFAVAFATELRRVVPIVLKPFRA